MKRSISMEDSADVSSIKQTCVMPRNRSYFPSDVLKFVKLNAKPRMSLKLMQVCKYFKHREFPYFVVKSVVYDHGMWTLTTLDDKLLLKPTLNEISTKKLWVTRSIILFMGEIDYQALAKKIIVCDANLLSLVSQTIPFNEIKPLCETIVFFDSYRSILYGDDKEHDISLESFLESLPNAETLLLDSSVPSIVSLERLNRAISPKLNKIQITNFQQTFNFSTFVDFVLQHQNIQFIIESRLHDLSMEFLLDAHIQVSRIILGWNCQYRPPRISYFGQSPFEKVLLELLHLQHAHAILPSNNE